MYKCQRCNIENNIRYGTGRYCSKKCAYTKNENQINSVSKPKSEETKAKMRKPKKDSSNMGKYDKSGDKNPNSIHMNGSLKDRDGDQYDNVCKSNKKNGQGWNDETIKNHSIIMKGDSNWMRGKKHTNETIKKIKNSINSKFQNGDFNSFTRSVSKAEREFIEFFKNNNIEYKHQYIITESSHRYDFYLPKYNLILEYYGDFWHANPKIYNEDKIIGRGNIKYKASDKWIIDKKHNEFAKNKGYHLIVIWESDYNNDKQLVLEKFKNNLYENFVLG